MLVCIGECCLSEIYWITIAGHTGSLNSGLSEPESVYCTGLLLQHGFL